MATAASGVITADAPPSALKSTSMTETTLSFAMTPLNRDVTILQSPRPMGRSTGATSPLTAARMLSPEFVTKLKWKSKLLSSQMMMDATRITVNAFWMKSFAFCHRSLATLFGLGIR